MIIKESLESAVQNVLDLGRGMKRVYFEKGETPPCATFLLDHRGNEQKYICSFLEFDEDVPAESRIAKNVFKHTIKRLIKRHKSHGVVILSDSYKLDKSGNRIGECLTAHGEARGLKISSFLPYTAEDGVIKFDEKGLVTADDAKGPWTGYFK